ncbi:2-(1,2-epoxy-1,2-dihydrophenyl)acetyl-CoA isomerase [Mycolicibacterium sp. BK634]|uniref:enoyl-CoA hydratase/isomerase family protein n=1 Tax=Mycolicibacterium sp. BK634 TaxID=2587099 RepID=UPI00161FFF33|nr:enoyl-CoA hydratase-related protein [Mycolicibacterium sp. BK634]MBB3753788.1 2-(1,2-epoxy-1,2-dihydrophenyl)acetyl-CoA isomerase [Mycolicibacterium sp. BK634]
MRVYDNSGKGMAIEMIDDIVVSVSDGVATLRLNRPDRLNALSWELMERLGLEVRAAGDNPAVRCVIVTGTGRAFSSGLDLTDTGSGAPEHMADNVSNAMRAYVDPLCQCLLNSPVPVVAAVNGVCAGGAVGLALLADVTIAARSSYFYIPHVVALGIVPDLGMTWTLPRVIGRARALGMALLGDRISAEEAQRWGLIWGCVDNADLEMEAAAVGAWLAQLNRGAASRTRALFDQASSTSLDDQLEGERTEVRDLIERASRG